MATFTMELRELVEVVPDAGLNDYPIFDEAYREPLNKKIIEHFWYREIGVETIDQFIFLMGRRMREIMPLYNQRYKSLALEIDPLITFRSVSDSEQAGTGSATSNGTSASNSTSDSVTNAQGYNSVYPQTEVRPDGIYEDTGARQTATTTGSNDATGTESASQESTQTSTGRTTAEGFAGSMSAMLMEYRDTFLNVDMEVISELENLFMLVWENGDTFTGRSSAFGFGPYSLGWI